MRPEEKEAIINAELNDIIGQERVKEELKSALLVKRNIIIVGPPGVGKTTLVKNLAKILPPIEVMDCGYNCSPEEKNCPLCKAGAITKTKKLSGTERFIRVQGSPDLTAEDLIGDIDPIKAMKYGPLSIEAFTPGKIFKANKGILFFDEINRCSEKLQNALLQVLAEKRVTIGSYDIEIESDFYFIGTMNPHDSSTEKLSQVFLDRFDLIRMSHPETIEEEEAIVKKETTNMTEMKPELEHAIIKFIRELREHPDIDEKPSVRATIGVIDRAKANAKLKGRKEATIEDVKAVITSVLSHRITLKPRIKYLREPEELVKDEFERFMTENHLRDG